MGLAEYKKKRRFNVTPEPGPKEKRSELGNIFVVQKHRATQLHYDFRLEADGVLKSWAVPRGPSMDPAVKRLAMQVEDHPVDYADFEGGGVIPEGEYGGGTVMVWDYGVYAPENVKKVSDGLKKGDLKFVLLGKKLKGSFVLVRTGDRQWLLIKHKDEYVREGEDIAETQPYSVSRNARSPKLRKTKAVLLRKRQPQILRSYRPGAGSSAAKRRPRKRFGTVTDRGRLQDGAHSFSCSLVTASCFPPSPPAVQPLPLVNILTTLIPQSGNLDRKGSKTMRISSVGFLVLLLAVALVGMSAMDPNAKAAKMAALPADPNPLLAEWKGPYGGVPRFDLVKVELFKPAMESAMAENLAEIDKIANNSAAPTLRTRLSRWNVWGRP